MIWERYFYKELLKTFAFLLFGFFAIYIAVDLMTHLKDLREHKTGLFVWITYYLCIFSRRLDVLIPFTVLIGSIRIFTSLQQKNELVALLVSGIPMQRLLRPFVLSAGIMSLLLLANFQFFLPLAQPKALQIQENSFGKKLAPDEAVPIREIFLTDGTRVYFTSFDEKLDEFYDLFWVVSLDKVYHMKSLNCSTTIPKGRGVDKIVRNSAGKMVPAGYYETLALEDMKFDQKALHLSTQLPKDQSISTLISETLLYSHSTSDRAVDIRSLLIYKCTFPLICLFALFMPAPYCLSFRRDMPHFMIYLLSLGLLFCFFLLLQVAYTLAKSQVLSPTIALGIPWIFAMGIVLFSVRKITK